MLREAALFDNSLTRKGIWKGGELFLLTVWDDCRFAYSYCDWRRLSPMVSTDTTDSFCLITCNFLLILPWLSPLWAPAFCLLGVRSLGSPLALWWYKHWHNHMFSCGVGTMLKFFFFCFSRIFLSFLVLCFERITFLGLFPVVCPDFFSYFSFHSRIYEAQRKYTQFTTMLKPSPTYLHFSIHMSSCVHFIHNIQGNMVLVAIGKMDECLGSGNFLLFF